MVKPQYLYKGQGDHRPCDRKAGYGQDCFDDGDHSLVSFAVVLASGAVAECGRAV
jgi:hypothetical protein